MSDFLEETMPIIMGIIITVLLIVGLYIFVDQLSIKQDNKIWNGGHCDVCEGKWEYEQAVGHRSTTSYIYVCSKCGKRIEISEVR
jgi:hypothetical protein